MPESPIVARLMVVEGESSTCVDLPDRGELTIGSGPHAGLRLQDPQVDPVQARLVVEPGGISVFRVGSSGRTAVNDEPLDGSRLLISGDVVTVGAVTLALHRVPLPVGRPVLDLAALRLRLRDEIERCQRTQRSVAVVVVQLPVGDTTIDREAAVDAIRRTARGIDLVGWDGGAEVVLVLPDTGETAEIPARRILAALEPLAPRSRAGIAVSPSDAQDADDLVTVARNAARGAASGEAARLETHVQPLQVGRHALYIVDPGMKELFALVRRLARSELPVLVTGETGVGKELVALALHEWSPRKGRPMVSINCAAVTETLFENELFGHEKGAFTDAGTSKAGLLESAAGGTVFLDEIGETSPRLQAKLLRVLETRRASRLGSVVERAIDVRIVAATNRDLKQEIAAGNFRRDLFFRLGAASVFVPPLRDRAIEIPILARAFLLDACSRANRPAMTLTRAAAGRLILHDWPGNIRELRNLMDFLASTVDGDTLDAGHLPSGIAVFAAPWLNRVDASPASASPGNGPFERFESRRFRSIRDEVRELERTRITEALGASGGVRTEAAKLLDMPLRTLLTRINEFGITIPSRRKAGRPAEGESA